MRAARLRQRFVGVADACYPCRMLRDSTLALLTCIGHQLRETGDRCGVSTYYADPGWQQQCATRMLELLRDATNPFERTHFEPGHFTASAFVFSADLDSLLLVRHPKLGRWLQPGGHVEPADASLESAAAREVQEETGLLDLSRLGPGVHDLDIHIIPARGPEPRHQHFDVRFAFRCAPGPSALHGSHEARFVPLPEVAALDSDASVVRGVQLARRW